MKREKTFTFLDITIIVVITSIIMYFLGSVLVYRHLGGINYAKLSTDENLSEFISAYNGILNNYYDTLNKEELIKGAIEGMYKTIKDPYTNYMDESNTANLDNTLNGKYTGIGVRIETTSEGHIRIYEVFDHSPAEKAGLKKGDIIASINGKSTESMSSTELVNIISTSGDSDIALKVSRESETLDFTLKTAELMVPVVEAKVLEMDNHKVGYIYLSIFNDTADTQFETAVSNLENSGIESLIIDLRNNTGGYLETAKNIAEMFIEKGKIIYSLKNKDTKSDYRDSTNEKRTYKIGVLLNKGSASASEILASSLKYSYGASLYGETSFGKGKVQERSGVSGGSTVKYTTALWLTPNGDCIDGIGLSPDHPLALDNDKLVAGDIYSDTQILYTLKNLVE